MVGEAEVIEVTPTMFPDVMVGVCWIDTVEAGTSMEGTVRVHEESVTLLKKSLDLLLYVVSQMKDYLPVQRES